MHHLVHSLIPWPLRSCEIKSGIGLGMRLLRRDLCAGFILWMYVQVCLAWVFIALTSRLLCVGREKIAWYTEAISTRFLEIWRKCIQWLSWLLVSERCLTMLCVGSDVEVTEVLSSYELSQMRWCRLLLSKQCNFWLENYFTGNIILPAVLYS